MNSLRHGAFLSLAAVLTLAGLSATAAELLPAGQAFALAGRLEQGRAVLRYRIADGYYLYRDKLRFSVAPPATQAGQPSLPKGRMKTDEFFGRVETYRGEVVIRLPVRAAAANEPIVVTAVSQGCADAGVCYPPQQVSLTLVPGQPETAAATPGAQGRKSLMDALEGKP
jgi:thioredoxin:protein disulfide reductase